MSKPLILLIILLFVCWCIYRLQPTEGFQTPPTEITLDKCKSMLEVYKSLKDKYDDAVKNNNEYLKDSLPLAIDSILKVLQNNNCDVPS